MFCIHDYLELFARENGDRDCLIFEGSKLSFGETNAQSNQLAHALLGAKINKGDRVAILSKNSIEYPIVFYGCSKVGAVPVPLNYRLAPPEWAYIINDSQARMLFVSAEYAEGINSVRDELSNIELFVVMDGDAPDGFTKLDEWIAGQSAANPNADVSSDDDVYQMYTSGTTGHPKGAVLRQRSVISHMIQFQAAMPRGAETTLVVAPVYHAAGAITMLVSISNGGTVLIQPDFHPVHVVNALSEGGVNYATLVPAMIQACLVMVPDAADRDYDNLKSIAYGASPIAAETLRQAMAVFKCDFHQAYGMTETTAVLTFLSPEDHLRAVNGEESLLLSAGRPLLGTRVKIVDDNENEVPPNVVGEICGQGPQIMRGYWNLDEASEKALAGGWMHTGDAGRIDEEGFLYVEDRVKDMIISGGENVYPREVENCVFQHEAVADCAVIGIPHEKWGETIKAIVCLKEGAELNEEDLIAFCRDRIAHYKCPTSMDIIPELPRNASGKVLKRELREKYWEGQGRRVS